MEKGVPIGRGTSRRGGAPIRGEGRLHRERDASTGRWAPPGGEGRLHGERASLRREGCLYEKRGLNEKHGEMGASTDSPRGGRHLES